jgi:hypothetical protein
MRSFGGGFQEAQAVEGAVELVLQAGLGPVHQLDGTVDSVSKPYSWSMMEASRLDMRMRRQRAVAMVSTSAVSVGVEGLYSA